MHVRIGTGESKKYIKQDKFARNSSVGTTLVDIWDAGGNLSFLGAAETMLVQSSGNDNGASSTGARTVVIEGLDNDYNEVSETVTTNATVDPETTQSFLRVNRAYVENVGSIGTNENDIAIVASSASTTQAQIGASLGQTLKSQYTVPAGFTAHITRFYGGVGKGDDIRYVIVAREQNKAWRVKRDIEIFENHVSVTLDSYISMPEKSDIKAQAAVSTGSGKVAAGYDFILTRD